MLTLVLSEPELAVCRLAADAEVPAWAHSGALSSVTITQDELSIVCEAAHVPEDVQSERGWRAFMVKGPLDFGLTGILASLAQPLASASISIFALSTYNTDYILVKETDLEGAVSALKQAGHKLLQPTKHCPCRTAEGSDNVQ